MPLSLGGASALIESRAEITATIQDAVDRHCGDGYVKRDRHPPLEADHSQPWPDVIPPSAALGKICKAQARALDPLDVIQGPLLAAIAGNIIIEREEIGLSFRRKDDSMRHA